MRYRPYIDSVRRRSKWLGGIVEDQYRKQAKQAGSETETTADRMKKSFSGWSDGVCTECSIEVSNAVEKYSKTHFGRELCIRCQRKDDRRY